MLCDVLSANVSVTQAQKLLRGLQHTYDRGVQTEVNIHRCTNGHNWGLCWDDHADRVLLKCVLAK
jgi:hypothetical protein